MSFAPLPAAALVMLFGLLSGSPTTAGEAQDRCIASIAAARQELAALPEGDISRRFAEHALHDARIEMENGEVEECPDLVEEARRVAETRPYALRPGERFGIPPRDAAN